MEWQCISSEVVLGKGDATMIQGATDLHLAAQTGGTAPTARNSHHIGVTCNGALLSDVEGRMCTEEASRATTH